LFSIVIHNQQVAVIEGPILEGSVLDDRSLDFPAGSIEMVEFRPQFLRNCNIIIPQFQFALDHHIQEPVFFLQFLWDQEKLRIWFDEIAVWLFGCRCTSIHVSVIIFEQGAVSNIFLPLLQPSCAEDIYEILCIFDGLLVAIQ
jgi:hypothetical protein